MKILLINTLYPPNILGGAERSVQIIAESLAKNGDDVTVISVAADNRFKKCHNNGCTLYYLDVKNLYNPFDSNSPLFLKPFWNILDTHNPFMARQVGKILDLEKPDVVHTNNLACFSVSLWSEIKKRKIPLVHTLRDYYLLCPRATMFHRDKNCSPRCLPCRLYSISRKIASAKVDAVVGNSQFILRQHLDRHYFGRSKFKEVIFSAYEPERSIDPKPPETRSVLRIGYLGRLKPNKGLKLLIAFAKIIENENIELWIGGRDEYSLKSRYESQNVHFMGFVDPNRFFPNIDLLIVPSLWHDPLPRTIFEAYAHGIPVIGSHRGGIPEIIEHGATGLVFNPDNLSSLWTAIKNVQENQALLMQLKAGALKKARDFSIVKSITRYRDLYYKVCSRHRC